MKDFDMEGVILAIFGIVAVGFIFWGVTWFIGKGFGSKPATTEPSATTIRRQQEQKIDDARENYERSMEQSRQRIRDMQRR